MKITGPIAVYGAAGFVGINLLNSLLKVRSDVIGLSSEPEKSWRIKANKITKANLAKCDLLDIKDIKKTLTKYKPQTIFNLAAYGAYSKQKDIKKIYETNFISTVNLIEELKKHSFKVYIHAGSQSEYGLNSGGPAEEGELVPNSHYALSKTAVYYLLKYYGKIERLPVIHARLYSAYGPWEEADRLMPVLVENLKKGRLPDFVDPDISRDFIYIEDVISALLVLAAKIKTEHYGEAFNLCTGKKTTIKELAYLAKKLFKIKALPKFGAMQNRAWDVKGWYGNPKKMQKTFGWRTKISLKEGLLRFYNHEK